MNALRTYLEQHLTISDTDWQIIAQRLTPSECPKGTKLTTAGRVEDRLYFILDGAFRLYFETESKETTLDIGFAHSLISSYSSYITRRPSDFNLEALTACRFMSIRHADLLQMYELTDCGHELGRILTEQIYLYFSSRENAFLLRSPTERYLDLFKEQPRLIKEIPLKHLASYIGVTPQALSRIRARIVQTD